MYVAISLCRFLYKPTLTCPVEVPAYLSKLFLGRVFDVDQTANFCLEYGCHMTFEKIGTSAVPYMYLPTP